MIPVEAAENKVSVYKLLNSTMKSHQADQADQNCNVSPHLFRDLTPDSITTTRYYNLEDKKKKRYSPVQLQLCMYSLHLVFFSIGNG